MRVWILLAAALLAGCGYQLRGTGPRAASLGTVAVAGPAWLVEEVAVALEPGGTTVVPPGERAAVRIEHRDDGFDRRVLSVDPATGKEREIELAYHLAFRAVRGDGSPLLDEQTVTLLRDYSLDPDAVIGKSREEAVLRREMRTEAVALALRRVESALGR